MNGELKLTKTIQVRNQGDYGQFTSNVVMDLEFRGPYKPMNLVRERLVRAIECELEALEKEGLVEG